MAVVKADAYGHGAVAVSRALADLGISCFGVATVQEGLELRAAGLQAEIVVLAGLFPEQIDAVLAASLTPVIHRSAVVAPLAGRVPAGRAPVPVHLKVDTGMRRLGVHPDEVATCVSSIVRSGTLRLDGLMTHLAAADDDPAATRQQLQIFQQLADAIQATGVPVRWRHAANSAAILQHPASHLTMARPGLMLYGYAGGSSAAADLRPVLTWTTRVLQVRDVPPGQTVSYNRGFTTVRPSRLAVLAIGYGDGYPRLLSNRGAVLLRGARAPIVGRVCMDLTIVDITDIPRIAEGDEAVLIGTQGADAITAVEVAAWAETIPYEILSTIGRRVLRLYRH